jgi:hypothetical protein
MAFAKPLVLDYGGAATKSLPVINQDSYGTEYFLKETTQEFRVKIRNSNENLQSDGTRFVRHNVDFTRVVYATPTTLRIEQQVYLVFRHKDSDDSADAAKLGEALSKLMVLARYTDLGGWLS